jgi:hypothetical protein
MKYYNGARTHLSLAERCTDLARRRSRRAHSLSPNGRTASPICPDLIYDRHTHAKPAAIDLWNMRRSFRLHADEIWETECPACKSRSFLAGVKYDEEVSEEDTGDDPYEELVDVSYVAEEFLCPSCTLHLDSREAIETVGLDVDHIGTETRQREYEPDYGND